MKLIITLLAVLLTSWVSAATNTLTIQSMHSDPIARKALAAIVADFKKRHPNIAIKVNTVDHESYKIQLRTWLPNNPPDIATWFAGNRAKYFVENELIEPIDDIWKPFKNQFSNATKSTVQFNNHYYLVPVTYYHWGFYYRKDIFKKAGIEEAPRDWEDFLKAVIKLKALGVTPITIGSKNGWPAAAWFDFLNLRLHGASFHLSLLEGGKSFQSQKFQETMNSWRELIELGSFTKNGPALSWQEGATLLWQGKAAMYLMGNFITSQIPAELKNQIGFFAFPKMNKSQPISELAPTDVYFIPKKAKNKNAAKLFLTFLLEPKTQTKLNQISGLLPPNRNATIDSSDFFLNEGKKLLDSAENLMQFFDRDAVPQLAKAGMDEFIRFMIDPNQALKAISNLERTRKRLNRKRL